MKNVAKLSETAPVYVQASRLSMAASGIFLILLTLLHFIKPELNPSWRMVSEYSIGRFGWVMVTAFLAMSISCIALFAEIRTQVDTVGGKIGLAFLLISSVAIAAAAVFTSDPMTASKDELTMHGNLHGLASMIGIPGLTIASILISHCLAQSPSWSQARRSLLWSANFIWISLLLMVLILAVTLSQNGGKFGPDVLIGWPNRLVMIAYCLWLMSVARHANRLRMQ
jgi:hypothetical protein